ncbi:MAG: molybdopterin-dependent oxidoreductase [Candidatus Kuenenia sp.]|nr:molybdopterin-dependent oxidoreductase [Candidatus Kuenenia hertensis]
MPIQWHKTTCSYCGFGCGLMVGVDRGKIVEIKGMEGHPTNDGMICTLPANSVPIFGAEGRLTKPMIRRDGKLSPVTWEEAIAHVAAQLKKIIETHGPGAVAIHSGAICMTEEYYLMNKLLKASIGSNNIESSTRLCMASSAMGFVSTIGADAPPACYDDIEMADLFFIAGNNMAVSVPVLFMRVARAKENNGAKVIVVDPRKSETSSIADIHLRIKPGTDVALNNALAHVLLKEGYVNEETVEEYASGLKDLKELLEDYPPSKASEITGCPEQLIIDAARTIGRSKAMLTFWFQGYNHSSQAVFKNNTLHNLWLLTNNFCRPGAGPLSITGECNALGCRWIGGLSHLLPGMRMVANPQHRQEIAAFWDIPMEKLRPIPGRSIIDIIRGLHTGDVRAFWSITTNPAASLPNTKWITAGLAKAELLIVQDIFHPTETTNLATVVLPAAQWCEKTGTFISSERRIELAEKIIDPPGDAKPDYEILCLIARAMGFEKEFPYSSPEEVFEELKKTTKGRICDLNGVTYERLRGKVGLQLPCPDVNHPGTPRLFTDKNFPRADGRAALLPREYKTSKETINEEYPFVLITSRQQWHFNTRTRTGRIPKLHRNAPDNFVEIHPSDAANLCINTGDTVEISSVRGTAKGVARVSDSVLQGTVYMPIHYGSAINIEDGKLANLVTNNVYDIHSKQPEYKFSAVKVKKARWS